ncbi:MAG: chemotaxis protein CheX [Candidatus Scalindua sp.]|nr:chemotaxis protein CheX [Candidatus Scalindua sp.]
MELKEVMEDIARDIADATKTLFQSMIMMELKYNHVVLADETHLKTDVTSFVSFMGKYHGIVGIFCSKNFSLKVASSMLMEDLTKITTEVIDAIGEITNMIAGNVKTKITTDYGEMDLSVPITFIGGDTITQAEEDEPVASNSSILCVTKEPWLLTSFSSDKETFNVGLLLKESARQ